MSAATGVGGAGIRAWRLRSLPMVGSTYTPRRATSSRKASSIRDPRADESTCLTGRVPIAQIERVVTVRGMSYPSDLTDDQWELLEPVFNAPGKRGRKHADTCGPWCTR
jgi:hypothetical protein